MAQLQTSHSDPQVAAGLLAIAKLDEELREASLKVRIPYLTLPPSPTTSPKLSRQSQAGVAAWKCRASVAAAFLIKRDL